MASQDNYFVVRKGIGVGTQALYADGNTKTVAIGKTVGNYPLDVVGKVYSSDAIYAQNNAGVGTTSNYQQFDVIGSAYVSNRIGIGTTVPTQALQVGASVVVTGIGSVGVGTTTPRYSVDIFGNARVTGLATISQSFTGIATIGIASITNAYIGIATIGIASITNERVGISTISRAIIESERVGISTIDYLYVTGITTTALLDVGVGVTILKAANFGITTVSDLNGNLIKTIKPLIGINTTTATRTLDVAGDVRIRGEVIDSNNNVGFAYSVLASDGNNIPGRFSDAANLLVRNKEFIANEVV